MGNCSYVPVVRRMLRKGQFAVVVFALIFFVGGGTKASAQRGSDQSVEIDCSAFQRQSDGSWTALHTTTIKIGTNSITRGSGRVNGSVNGLDMQEAINRQCSKEAPQTKSRGSALVYEDTNWKKTPQTSSECVARGRELVQGFPAKTVAGETVFASSDGYTFIIRCTPQNMIFFVVVGPPDGTTEREKAAEGLFDRILGQW
jgi:hypothetical protein